ncbi:hypothetical protein ACF1BS_19465 [Streptomyces sp. NPDC014748]
MDSLPPPPAELLAPVGEQTWRNRLVTLVEMPPIVLQAGPTPSADDGRDR